MYNDEVISIKEKASLANHPNHFLASPTTKTISSTTLDREPKRFLISSTPFANEPNQFLNQETHFANEPNQFLNQETHFANTFCQFINQEIYFANTFYQFLVQEMSYTIKEMSNPNNENPFTISFLMSMAFNNLFNNNLPELIH